MSKVFILILGGTAAGFINGLLGTGGGIVLIFMLGKLLADSERKNIFATVLTVTAVLSLVSLFIYSGKGGFDISGKTVMYAISAIPGGLLGAYLLDRLEVGVIKKLFGFLVIFAGLNMAGGFK